METELESIENPTERVKSFPLGIEEQERMEESTGHGLVCSRPHIRE